eukprot:5409433-Prymnesium_polylepis.1
MRSSVPMPRQVRLPYPWEEAISRQHGRSFFYNAHTGERRWTPPPTLLRLQVSALRASEAARALAAASLTPLPHSPPARCSTPAMHSTLALVHITPVM